MQLILEDPAKIKERLEEPEIWTTKVEKLIRQPKEFRLGNIFIGMKMQYNIYDPGESSLYIIIISIYNIMENKPKMKRSRAAA